MHLDQEISDVWSVDVQEGPNERRDSTKPNGLGFQVIDVYVLASMSTTKAAE